MFIWEHEWGGKTFYPDQQESSSYHIMLPHVNMKLHRVHMAGRGNATIIFLVALQGIWLKCRLKIHINLKNKQMHFTALQTAEVWNVYSNHETITLFTLQKGSAAVVTTQGNVAFYNRVILLTGCAVFQSTPSSLSPFGNAVLWMDLWNALVARNCCPRDSTNLHLY